MYIRTSRHFMPYMYRPSRYYIGEPAAAVAPCPGYQSGEIKKSKTEPGHLPADVVEEPGRLLIGDFGVNWRHLKRTTKNDPLLREWLQKFENEDSYRLRILGYSDCIGKEKNNRLLRLGRAERVFKLLGRKTRSRVLTKKAAPKDTYITDKNVEFATWGGDLGSAVGLKVYDEYDRNLPIQDWDKYLLAPNTRASAPDFNGDIDAYAIGTFLTGKCAQVSKTAITKIDTPISKLLYDYYVDDRKPLSQMRQLRIGCFIQGIGGETSGVIIKDKPVLYNALSARVNAFATAYYTALRRPHHTFLNAYPSGIGTKIIANTHQAVQQFVYWLEGQI